MTTPTFLDLREFSATFSDVFGVKNPKTGRTIRFTLAPHQHSFNYFSAKDGLHCYTPHKDDDGNYWAWTYKPRKNGVCKMTRLVRCAKRVVAKRKALDRYYKAEAKAQAQAAKRAARKAARS